MNLEEKNNHYHYILSILRRKDEFSEEVMAKDITLYLEAILNQKELEIEERKDLFGGDGAPNLPLPRFGKMFKRVT